MSDASTQGQRIRQMRLECRFTQEYVAAQLSTTKQAIYKYEADLIKNIPADKLLQLSQLFRCSPAWLQGFTEERGAPIGEATPPVDIPCGTPHHTKNDSALGADDQFTFYRDLMNAMARLTPTERDTVLQFTNFLASKHEPHAE